jgi:hypothetical protein
VTIRKNPWLKFISASPQAEAGIRDEEYFFAILHRIESVDEPFRVVPLPHFAQIRKTEIYPLDL